MGNIDADSGLTWFPHRTLSDPSREHFIFENDPKCPKYNRISFLDKSADMAEFHEKNVRESCVWVTSTRIHDIGHIHMMVFSQS